MSPSNPLFALIIILITFSTGYLITLKYEVIASSKRVETIDGLRGFLAICVFIHHSNIWYRYLHTGDWVSPESNLYNQLGETGVAFFFMISSFLFVKILIDFKGDNYDWKSFFIRRFLRLAPVHFLITSIVIIIVFIQSNWVINTDYLSLVKSIIKWFSFGTIGLGNVNGYKAILINAGVLWSLPYEWLLYFLLPAVSIFTLKSKPKIYLLLISLSFLLVSLQFRTYHMEHIFSLLGGAIAPIILKFQRKPLNFNSKWITLILVLLILSIFQFHSPSNPLCKVLIALAFTLIALGNSFFGLLKNATLKFLGTISYSTYLIHGVLLFVVVNYLLGVEESKMLSQL